MRNAKLPSPHRQPASINRQSPSAHYICGAESKETGSLKHVGEVCDLRRKALLGTSRSFSGRRYVLPKALPDKPTDSGWRLTEDG